MGDTLDIIDIPLRFNNCQESCQRGETSKEPTAGPVAPIVSLGYRNVAQGWNVLDAGRTVLHQMVFWS